MKRFAEQLPGSWRLILVAAVSILVAGSLVSPGHAYTPDSPVVLDMVERGIAYLEKEQAEPAGIGTDPTHEGGLMLAAYTHYKVRQDPNHPVVTAGVQTARALARRVRSAGGLPTKTEITYETSVAILLMIDFDAVGLANDIQLLANALVAVQKGHGGFGYLNEQLGDTSQTQYCVLAMWSLDQADFSVPKAAMKRATEWLLRTQDPSGQWPYKPADSGRVGLRVKQDPSMSHSLTSAGAGSVLIGGDFFGLWRSAKQLKPDVEGLPPALKEQTDVEEMKRKRESFNIPGETLMQYIKATETHFANSPYRRPGGKSWFYYYIYTLERYKSFLEVALGKQEKEPLWYNEGVEMLRGYQLPDGSWGNPPDMSHSNGQISTCFSVLFLIRSTKKAIGDMGEGLMAGGYELPKDTTDIRRQGTQITAAPSAVVVTDLLSLLEGEDASKLDAGSIPENLKLAEDREERKKQLARLERVARGSDSHKARQVAVRLLAQSDSLDAVPSLIYALTDPDFTTRRFARDGLRFTSRRLTGFGMPLDADKNEVRKAVKNWQDWYNRIDPGYVFFDY